MARPLDRVAVIGAGVLVAQIAMLAANAGYTTKIYDPVAGAFENTYTKIWNDLKAKGVGISILVALIHVVCVRTE